MTRARILADYVSSGDELAFKAPLISPALVTPNLGTPSAGVMTNMTGAVEASLVDNAVTLAKMAGGTDGQVITYDASGDPVAVGPGTDGQVLTSTGAGGPPAFEDAGGGANTPSFLITGSDVTGSNHQRVDQYTLINFKTTVFDTGSYWVTGAGNWKFLPTDAVSKKYYIYSMIKFQDSGDFRVEFLIYRNGSAVARSRIDQFGKYETFWQATTVTLDGVDDYVQMYCYYTATAGGSTPGDNKYVTDDALSTYFGGYALIN